MTDDDGGFHSAEDADSEGVEGKFYVWTAEEIDSVLGAEIGERFRYVYDVSESGNFEGKNILNLPKSIAQCAQAKDWDLQQLEEELASARKRLLAVRDMRVPPGKDDKIIVAWNGLMIDSVARAAAIFDSKHYRQESVKAADFLLTHLRREDGRLLHVWRQGQAKHDAYLDDYTCLANALVTLYETDFQERWIDEAAALMDVVLEHFRDADDGGLFYTADDHEKLIVRTKDLHDGSTPGGAAMATTVLMRLGKLTASNKYLDAATELLELAADTMERMPMATGQTLLALDSWIGPMKEIVVIGDPLGGDLQDRDTADVLKSLRNRFLPNSVLACRSPDAIDKGSSQLAPLFAGKVALESLPSIYVCENCVCSEPIAGKQAAIEAWDHLLGERSVL